MTPGEALALAVQVRAGDVDAVDVYGRLHVFVGGWHPDDRRPGLLAWGDSREALDGPAVWFDGFDPAACIALGALADACEDMLDNRGLDRCAVALAALGFPLDAEADS